jgi:hypothetical protein
MPAHSGAFKRVSTKNKKRVELRATGLELTNASSNKFLIWKFLATLNKLEKEFELLSTKVAAGN